jgi:uncharacterized protein (DUF697 family)
MSRKLPEVIRTRRPGSGDTPPPVERVEPAGSAEDAGHSEPEAASPGEPAFAPVAIPVPSLPAPRPAAAAAVERRRQAQEIVATHAAWSSAFGLMPIPIADVAGISGTQLRMVAALSGHYGVPFSRHWARSILGAVVGSGLPWVTTRGLVSTLFKSMPGIGLGVGLASMAGLSNLSTRTLGWLFIEHFEAGGSLADVDTARMREAFLQKTGG